MALSHNLEPDRALRNTLAGIGSDATVKKKENLWLLFDMVPDEGYGR